MISTSFLGSSLKRSLWKPLRVILLVLSGASVHEELIIISDASIHFQSFISVSYYYILIA